MIALLRRPGPRASLWIAGLSRRPYPRPTATAPAPCTHPADALTARPAGTLSRAVVQTCGCCGGQ